MTNITSKQQALDLFETERHEFLEHCRWVARRIYNEKGHVTIDDVREQVILPKNIDGRVFGAVFNTSDWEKTGYTHTSRKTSHHRPIAVFVLKTYPKGEQHTTIFQASLFH